MKRFFIYMYLVSLCIVIFSACSHKDMQTSKATSNNSMQIAKKPSHANQAESKPKAQALNKPQAHKESSSTKSAQISLNASNKQNLDSASMPNKHQAESNKRDSKDSKSLKTPQNEVLQNEATQDSVDSVRDSIESTSTKPLPLSITFNDLIQASVLADRDEPISVKPSKTDVFDIVAIYDSHGVLRAELSFKNALLEGESKAYDTQGNIVRVVPYKAGLVDGIMQTFRGDGHKEESFKAGKKNGTTRIYMHNKLIAQVQYHNDFLDGESISYYDSGVLRSKTTYANGKKQGLSQGFVQGKLAFLQQYHNDFLDGEAKTYGENEILKIQQHYTSGFLDGSEIVYDYPSQKVLYRATYQKGALIEPYENHNKSEIYWSMKPLDFAHVLTKQSDDLYMYPNGQIAFQRLQEPSKQNTNTKDVIINTYAPNGNLESSFVLQAQETLGRFYDTHTNISSEVVYAKDSKMTLVYNLDGSLRTKSIEKPAQSTIQSFKNGILESEIVWLEGQNITIYKGFFPNQSLRFEHYYKDNTMIKGTLYDTSHKVISSFQYHSEDEIFDEAFPKTAAYKRLKVMPNIP